MNSQAVTAPARSRLSSALLAGLFGICAFILLLAPERAEAETIIKAHGISAFGDLKYPEGFAHFDYVNPDAPMTGSADEPDAMYGLLAESIEYPESKQWAIFNLRPEAKFSDGSPVTAEDVVFSFNILIEKGRPSYKSTFSDFEKVEGVVEVISGYTGGM